MNTEKIDLTKYPVKNQVQMLRSNWEIMSKASISKDISEVMPVINSLVICSQEAINKFAADFFS